MKIKWKDVNTNKPSGLWPFQSCFVYVCNPKVIVGGIIDIVRWDRANGCWMKSDMNKWFYDEPYKITHFSDEEVNTPEK